MIESFAKRLGFRLGAVCLGLGLVLLFEVVLRWGGLGGAALSWDPHLGLRDVRPLFERDETGEFFQTATTRTNYFVRDRFPVVKKQNHLRVFCLGGSTVQGRPYAIETAFPRWMALSLQARDPSLTWEIVNVGGVSYASYRLVPILEECLRHYQPDLIILCTGQNEFLEDRTYAPIREQSPVLLWWQARSQNWRIPQLFSSVWRGLGKAFGGVSRDGVATVRPILPAEVDAFLDYRGGLEAYRWDPGWRAGVVAHFESNVTRMLGMCRQAKVPALVLSPPVNLRSVPPFKSEHRAALSAQELTQWQRCISKAEEHYAGAPETSVQWLRRAIKVDPQYAETHFALGTVLEGMGRRRDARRSFVLAKERDVCPLRLLEVQRETLATIARRYDQVFVDLHDILERESGYMALGSELLVDHVHPSIRGHQLIGTRLVDVLVAEGWAENKAADWREEQAAAFARHLEALPGSYYAHGNLRLENLRLWTQGRTDGMPLRQMKRNSD